ncbi:MAG: ArsR family transcriptional regulator [Proteobacteria bacterium]|nr:ArsR family transcriptional regulator [Pseudomonadota bacterium]
MNTNPIYAATLRRTRRRVILEILSQASPPAASEITLEPVLDSLRIYGSDRDAIRSELAWLADRGFVEIEDVAGIMFATLLADGAAIAAGKRVHPDIEKPPLRKR